MGCILKLTISSSSSFIIHTTLNLRPHSRYQTLALPLLELDRTIFYPLSCINYGWTSPLNRRTRHLSYPFSTNFLLSLETWQTRFSGLALRPILLHRPYSRKCNPNPHKRDWDCRCASQQHWPSTVTSRNGGNPPRVVSFQRFHISLTPSNKCPVG